MAYEIKKSDGTVLVELTDGLADSNSTSLTLIGRNLSNFGQQQNQNFVRLIENFSKSTSPSNPLKGQIWYDSTNGIMKVFQGIAWQPLAAINFSATTPTNVLGQNFWFKTDDQQLYINTGTEYILVGPDKVPGFGTTKMVSTSLVDTVSVTRPVLKVTVNNEVIGIISTSSFTIGPSNLVSGFTQVYRGITLKNYTSGDVQMYARSKYADTATFAISATTAVSATNATTANSSTYATSAGTATTSSYATTRTVTDKSERIANTEFVHNILPKGVILLWSGSGASIPTGWALCNGSNGTPDLRSKFVIGAGGSYAHGDTGGSNTVAITNDNLPSHHHSFSFTAQTAYTGNHIHGVYDPAHYHIFPGDDQLVHANGRAGWAATSVDDFPYDARSTLSGGGRMWRTSVSYTGIEIDEAGGHLHAVSGSGNTNSTGAGTAINVQNPYYALAYIMKTTG